MTSGVRGIIVQTDLRAAPGIQAEPTAAVGDDLQETAGDGDILEEMDELVLIGESVVEEDGGREGENGDETGRQPGAISQDEGKAAQEFDGNGDPQTNRGKRQARRFDVADHPGRVGDFVDPRQQENRTDEEAPDEWGGGGKAGFGWGGMMEGGG